MVDAIVPVEYFPLRSIWIAERCQFNM